MALGIKGWDVAHLTMDIIFKSSPVVTFRWLTMSDIIVQLHSRLAGYSHLNHPFENAANNHVGFGISYCVFSVIRSPIALLFYWVLWFMFTVFIPIFNWKLWFICAQTHFQGGLDSFFQFWAIPFVSFLAGELIMKSGHHKPHSSTSLADALLDTMKRTVASC